MCLVHNFKHIASSGTCLLQLSEEIVDLSKTCEQTKLLMMVCGKALCKSTAKEETILSCIDNDLAA